MARTAARTNEKLVRAPIVVASPPVLSAFRLRGPRWASDRVCAARADEPPPASPVTQLQEACVGSKPGRFKRGIQRMR